MPTPFNIPSQRQTPSRHVRAMRPFRVCRAFTLIELIVAVSITSVMLLLVSRVFNETTKAINIGADTSQIVSNSRILSDQLFQDLSRINRPKANQKKPFGGISQLNEPAGFMVLIQQTNAGLRFPVPDKPRQDPENWQTYNDANRNNGDTPGVQDPGEEDWAPIRTDQIGFFTPADVAESLTPGGPARYDSDAAARYQRVWYGHAARANLDGTLPANTEPGQPRATLDDDFDFTLVTDLVLGRQGLLILDDQSLWPDGTRVFDGSAFNPPAGNQFFALAGDATGGGLLGTRIDELNVPNTDPDYNQLWKGATDTLFLRDTLLAQSNFSAFFELAYDNIAPQDGVYASGVNQGPNSLRVSPRTQPDALDANELPNVFYNRHALSWLFASPGQRLITTQDLNYPYEPQEVGRNHAFFIPYVSDFAVDFAADITDDYALADDPDTFDDVNGNGTQDVGEADIVEYALLPWWDERFAPGAGQWDSVRYDGSGPVVLGSGFVPDGLPDGRPDEYTYVDAAGNRIVGIKWYSMAERTPASGNIMLVEGVNAGEPRLRNTPITYWLPVAATPAQVGNIASSNYANGPYLANSQQTIGIYHSPTVTPGTGILSFNYPPFVGWYVGGSQQGFYSADPSDTPPANVDARAVFVFGHSGDFDLNGAPVGDPVGDGSDVDGFEAGSAKWWPYALRVRYRLHDGDATYNSVGEVPTNAAGDEFDPISGKWFEQIVPVPHHDTHRPELPQ